MEGTLFWVRWIVLLGAGIFVGVAIVITIDGWSARPAPADVAIVLGNKVLRDGQPSRRLAARLDAARDLFEAKLVPYVIVSGGTQHGIDEGVAMRRYLLARGLPADRVLADSEGANTRLTAKNARRLMVEHGFDTAVVVSQFYHLTRIRLACAAAGIRVTGASAARFVEWRDVPSLAREVIGLGAYALGFREGEG